MSPQRDRPQRGRAQHRSRGTRRQSPSGQAQGSAPSRPTPQRTASARQPGSRAGGPSLRDRVERRSAPALVRLSAQPRWLVPLVAVALLLTGLAVRTPVGALPLLLLFAGMAWLVYLSWPAVDRNGRVVRLLATLLVLGAALSHLR